MSHQLQTIFGKNKIIAAVYGPREVHPKHMPIVITRIARRYFKAQLLLSHAH